MSLDTSDTDAIDEQRKRRGEGGGARIRMQDGRVSKALSWFWGAMGVGFISVVGLAANNLYQLNIAVNSMVANSAAVALQIKDHEDRLRAVERDVNTLEGKVFRGVDGYDADARHGR